MPATSTRSPIIRAITTCVPSNRFDNLRDTTDFEKSEVQKVVRMAGVKFRRVSDANTCSSDLCLAAAKDIMESLQWEADSIDALIFVTQSPDYFLPSTACLIHRDLGLSDQCAAFDLGLGCSGYPYALWLASMMLQGPGIKRVLVLHGETPTKFAEKSDRSVALLFGDAGSATAIEASNQDETGRWWFSLHTDGSGSNDLIIQGGGFRERFPEDPSKCFVKMNGSGIFNFTIKRVPALIEDSLSASGLAKEAIDYFIFHQSNRFIMKHLAKKSNLPIEKVPLCIEEFGSAGGPSIPLTITQGNLNRPETNPLKLLILGYGVGLSWGSALIQLPPETLLNHIERD